MKKYVTILCDGMADRDDERGLTPMDEARKPTMDALCKRGITGLVQTVPNGMKPGSDVCNLAALGYDPQKYYTGRSPLEALSMGIALGENDAAYRVNLVTLSNADKLGDRIMLDYSAGEISTSESAELVDALKPLYAEFGAELYAGISYRHAAVIRGTGNTGTTFTPPHDITNRPINGKLPNGRFGQKFTDLIRRSIDVLKDLPVNVVRRAAGKNTADAVWFWGEGTKPALEKFSVAFGKTAAVVSAVDLVKGIGVAGGMTVINVPTATGTVDTDYAAKTAAALDALRTHDFCFVHLEGPDECGHQGDRRGKITSIERIDAQILKPIVAALEKSGAPFAVCVMPDHATPLSVRTHTSEPVPFMIYDSERHSESGVAFSEKLAATTGLTREHGYDVIKTLFA